MIRDDKLLYVLTWVTKKVLKKIEMSCLNFVSNWLQLLYFKSQKQLKLAIYCRKLEHFSLDSLNQTSADSKMNSYLGVILDVLVGWQVNFVGWGCPRRVAQD